MAEHTNLFEPGAPLTMTAGADIVGGQLVSISADRTVVPTAASTAAWLGAAAFDAKSGEKVTVIKGGVQALTANTAVAAGDVVIPAAGGQVVPIGAGNAAHSVGVAIRGAAAGAKAEINFNR